MLAELSGMEILGISEVEVQNLASGLAKVMVARGALPKAERHIRKFGPWTNFLMVLAAIYGPRFLILWKTWQAERAQRKKRVLTVIREGSDSEAAPGPDFDKAVN